MLRKKQDCSLEKYWVKEWFIREKTIVASGRRREASKRSTPRRRRLFASTRSS